MKRNKVLITLFICLILACTGCKENMEEQKAGEDGIVSMSAVVSHKDYQLKSILYNKTEKGIVIGEEYSLQYLKGESFVDIPFLREAGAFNAIATIILPDGEHSCRVDLKFTYGDLESGHYRIVKKYRYQEEKKQKDYTYYTVTAEFDLP